MEFTHEQAEELGRRLQPMIGYVVRVRERMQRVRFTLDHPLYVKLRKAELALLDFSIALHYASCQSGVGKPPAACLRRPPTVS